ncbi:MAG: DUF6477 family protein [Paracoccus sp. (in: a-proteobacteria)]|uniref:DUF6477 family protein n=1 Tax=Paracoccus sp. TaxID=267 RepID=UPI0026DF8CDA|nr:DUF6477 family protein [Paracoccus sp. (in: a-proteobacteria)]MDO5631377.1 DUF6477 family protein [Paracoccus sp. (in: a-proteobacteria)]
MHTTTNVIAFRPRAATGLRRPRVLIRAAREGQSGWKRDRDLPKLLRSDHCPAPGAALLRLRAEEEHQNTARLSGAAEYDMRRHVMLMIAILAEMRAVVVATPAACQTQAAPPRPRVAAAAMSMGINARGTAIQARL